MHNSVKLILIIASLMLTTPLLAHGGHEFFTMYEHILHIITSNYHLVAIIGGLVTIATLTLAITALKRRAMSRKPAHSFITKVH